MPKIFLGFLLAIISLFPNNQLLDNIERKIESAVDQPKIIEANNDQEIIPEQIVPSDEMVVKARAAYFIDEKSGKVLLSKNENQKLPIASLTKLMTALIAVEKIKEDEIITVKDIRPRKYDASMGLANGDRIKFRELLHGLLITSASDAALAIANHVSGSEEEFVALMNEKAKILGLNDTQFSNPVGWDSANNYSNAVDASRLSRIALSNKKIADVVAKKSYLAKSENGRQFILINTNKLLGDNILGIKTGTTYQAGECLASYYKEGNKEIIGVILGSNNRFGETSKIINWIKGYFIW